MKSGIRKKERSELRSLNDNKLLAAAASSSSVLPVVSAGAPAASETDLPSLPVTQQTSLACNIKYI